mmetsp:Transcript_64078/g.193444  ORF Transcript_64078/g.193444 Transcript_64078/m.193444 type:complete len:214 (+) Transcript_64078:2-643(+)
MLQGSGRRSGASGAASITTRLATIARPMRPIGRRSGRRRRRSGAASTSKWAAGTSAGSLRVRGRRMSRFGVAATRGWAAQVRWSRRQRCLWLPASCRSGTVLMETSGFGPRRRECGAARTCTRDAGALRTIATQGSRTGNWAGPGRRGNGVASLSILGAPRTIAQRILPLGLLSSRPGVARTSKRAALSRTIVQWVLRTAMGAGRSTSRSGVV